MKKQEPGLKYKAAMLSALLFFLFTVFSSQADNSISSGTTLKVSPGSFLVSADNFDIKSGGSLNNSGTIILKKNLVNENATSNSLGTGTLELSGATIQTISGQNIIQYLVVNNAAGVILGGNTAINGVLTLLNGRLDLDAYNLLLGASSSISGTASATAMIVATGTGELRKEFAAGYTGSFLFPVGDNTGTPEYSPLTLNVIGGTFIAGNYIGVRLRNEKYPDPNVTGNYLNRYWTLSQSGITGLTCNAAFTYLPADVSGTENLLSCTGVNPLPWVTYSLTNAVSHQLTAINIVRFGSFTGVKTSSPPNNQTLVNIDIPAGVTNCYDATQVLTVAGNGAIFLVENGGSVTLVAGGSILLMEGTKVNSGGYLHGFITTNGHYCGSLSNPLVANQQNEDNVGIEPVTNPRFIRIYPNPTTDLVTVEIMAEWTAPSAIISVYNMQGIRLLQKTINGEPKFQFSLSGKPDGIYMVQVQSSEHSEIAKVVKH